VNYTNILENNSSVACRTASFEQNMILIFNRRLIRATGGISVFGGAQMSLRIIELVMLGKMCAQFGQWFQRC